MDSLAQIEQRFNCAVDVIHSLPKKGSFQPSNDMLLRFYSLFKQANNGPCTSPRPNFWDPIGRAKYDAWHSLGDMSQHEAMENYVEELKKIVEVMPQTTEVESFTRSLGRFYEMVDLDKPVALERAIATAAKSSPNRTPSPVHSSSMLVAQQRQQQQQGSTASLPALEISISNGNLQTERVDANENSSFDETTDDEQFADTVDTQPSNAVGNLVESRAVLTALDRLQAEVSGLAARMSNIERTLNELVSSHRPSQTEAQPNRQVHRRGDYPISLRAILKLLRIRSLVLFLLPIVAGFLVSRRLFFVRRR